MHFFRLMQFHDSLLTLEITRNIGNKIGCSCGVTRKISAYSHFFLINSQRIFCRNVKPWYITHFLITVNPMMA
jgi:hypothetical protein